MAEETISIIRFDTGQAVQSIGDLRANIKAYKEALNELAIGSKEYDDTLKALQINQAALKGAMHATTAEGQEQTVSMEQVAKAAMGAGNSYNALVKQMAELDQAFRSTEDATERAALGKQIKGINDQLKALDEERGKFGRNVGNYKSAIEGLSGAFKATAGNAGSIINPLAGVTTGLKALSATPAIAILGLLANALSKVVEGLKSSETNTNEWKTALAAFKPIADAATRTIQAVGSAIAGVANWVVDLLEKWGWMSDAMRNRQALEDASQKIQKMARQNMVENAKDERDASELRAKAAEKDRYTAEERLRFLDEAYEKEKAIMVRNKALAEERYRVALEESKLTDNSAEVNDELARLQADAIQAETDFNKHLRRLQSERVSARREIAAENKKAVNEEVQTETEANENRLATWEDFQSSIDEWDKKREEERQRALESEKELNELLMESDAELTESIQSELDAQLEAEWNAKEQEKMLMRERINTFMSYGSAVAGVANALAEVYEQDAEADEKAAKKSKALRTAGAIISTISGAISAFMSTWKAEELPLRTKMVLAPINAASVLAAGYAQVKQINSVKVGSGSGASVAAPAFAPNITRVRSITGQTEQEILNQKQRVYLVYSDIQVANTNQRVKVQETEF